MKYSIGTNFDPGLIEVIKRNDPEKKIKSVFGKLQKDIFGGGRSSYVLPKVSWRQLREHIEECHKANLDFNYLINPQCYGSKEMDGKYNKELDRYVEDLMEIGVDAVTINSPYLTEKLKKKYPKLKITIGLYAYVESLQRVKYWEELGADELTLGDNFIRDFELLEKTLYHVKNTKTEVRLIGNNICLHDCPYGISHGNAQSHASEKGDDSSNFSVDFCMMKCTFMRINDPTQFVSSAWIRPEDIRIYDELCEKVGVETFSIKLLDRTRTTDYLENVIRAYVGERFEGNLLDIMNLPSTKGLESVDVKGAVKEALKGRYNVKGIMKYKDIFDIPDIHVDNRALDGFIDYFVNHGKPCDAKICETYQDEETLPYMCNYCKTWAKKSVSMDDKEADAWKEDADSIFAMLKDGSFYRPI